MNDIIKRLRWRLWNLVTRSRRVCPVNAHWVIIEGERRSPLVDYMCRADYARNGTCFCGNLRMREVRHG